MSRGAAPVDPFAPLVEAVATRLADRLLDGLIPALAEAVSQPRPELITPADLAMALSVSSATVTRLVQRGCPHVLLGSARRFRLAEVVAWLKEGHGAG